MNKIFEFIVNQGQENLRLDKFLATEFAKLQPEITRSKIQNLCKEKAIFDEKEQIIENLSQKTKLSQKIIVKLQQNCNLANLPLKENSAIKFEIVFEDEDLIIINKPANLTVHPGNGNKDNTLANGLIFSHKSNLSNINGNLRPGIVHRLDKDTNGLMLIAKNDFSHLKLSQALQNKEVKRNYFAFIYGLIEPNSGRIQSKITRSTKNRLKMCVSNVKGRLAITNYQTKEVFGDNFASLVECSLETGRTHQIRVHLEAMKRSIIGDQLYNSCKKNISLVHENSVNSLALKNFLQNFNRQALQAYKIGFNHPRSGKFMEFSIPFSNDLFQLYQLLQKLDCE